ncbi:MAG: dTDP-4-dehydrorhamnose 3,5-epimerase [Phaeodactylibacter sp.]|nr:dTDP-4-dehydrorhamnose 3,5-epimerase [Phaeodactylibacter sp.]MCB9048850.1 dTDP-4-dehydrorhamnose 3,5-epimerase [Lewinellaceae bacterium]
MIFRETRLAGAYIIEPEPFSDQRGLFARTFCRREFEEIGHHKEFVQFNHSLTRQKGTLRGLHYQRPPHAEIKLIRCIRGAAYDVIVDIRRGSRTFLGHISVQLTEQNMKMIYVPEGFAHGFQALESGTELIYHHTAYYAPDSEGGIRYDDPLLGIEWPLPVQEISLKDQGYPYLESHFSGVLLS